MQRDRGSFKGVRVLVVEDHDDSRDLLIVLFEHHGMEVLAASCLSEAFEIFERHRPQVIVSDLGLPDGDGCSFIRQVREIGADDAGRVLPAVALTANLVPEVRQRALKAGFHECLAKPFELSTLLDVLERLQRTAQTVSRS